MVEKTNVNQALLAAFDDESEGMAPVSKPAVNVRERRARQPLNGRAMKLEVLGKIEGYHLYIAKDEGARIQLMLNAGYEFVSPAELEGFGAQAENTDPGNRVRFVLGSKGNEPLYGYLMKIPEQFWLEDQAALEKVNRDIDDQIRRGQVGTKQGDDERRYTNQAHSYDPIGNSAQFVRSKST